MGGARLATGGPATRDGSARLWLGRNWTPTLSCATRADRSSLTSISRMSRAEIRRQIGAGRGEKLPEGTTDCGKYCEVLPGKSEIVLPITSFLRIWHNDYQKSHLADGRP